jgi:hypothetical protein
MALAIELGGILDEIWNERIEAAGRDEAAMLVRQEFGEAVAAALKTGGQVLWIGGSLLGPDRAEGKSPFEFGNDAVVGLATVMQIGGELVSGAITLFAEDNRYAAAALTRQLVEVEYLAWAFAEDEEEAEKWMRSSKDERQELWQPRHLRARADGRFRGVDYGLHCGKGGHPSPEGIYLLPDHYSPDASAPLWWCDMAIHGHSVWSYALAAAERLGQGDVLSSLEEASALSEVEGRWRNEDPFIELMDEACARQARRRGGLAGILLGLRQEGEALENPP